MRRFLSVLTLLAVPVSMLALDYTPSTQRYTDARSFATADAAGISVLTNLGVVSGDPNGSFQSRRTLNRAEFTKIAMELYARKTGNSAMREDGFCFSDVNRSIWFAPYLCQAKDLGFVRGDPDGLFHADRAINYVEAVKILVEVFGYELPQIKAGTRPQWYERYVLAADDHDVLLPGIMPGDFISRGTMARLGAAFYAESQGELSLYRATERGETVRSSSSSSVRSSSSSSLSSSSSSRSSSSVSSSVSSSSSSAASSVVAQFVRSRFLVVGSETPPIAAAAFRASLEPMFVRAAEVKLEREIESIDAMFIVDSNGTTIGQIHLDHIFDTNDKTWRGTFPIANAYKLPKDIDVTLGVVLRLKPRNGGGKSEELVEVDTFRITAEGEYTGSQTQSAPNTFSFPLHQTAQANITSVQNVLSSTDAIPLGTNQLLAGFSFGGTVVAGALLKVEQLEFQVSKSSDVTITNWQLGIPETNERLGCTTNGSIVSCSAIPDTLGMLSGTTPRVLRLYGDVTVAAGAVNPSLQISLNQPGSPMEGGAIRWTDGSADFIWTDFPGSPIARSTRFQ